MKLLTITILILLLTPVNAQKKKPNDYSAGILYGDNYAYGLKAPNGWIFDDALGRKLGLTVVFYPKGGSWVKSPAVMYSSIIQKKKRTFNTAVSDEINSFKKNNPHLEMKVVPSKLRDDKRKVWIYVFSKINTGAVQERVAYIDSPKTVIVIVLTAKTLKSYENSIPAFNKVLDSFFYMTDRVIIKK